MNEGDNKAHEQGYHHHHHHHHPHHHDHDGQMQAWDMHQQAALNYPYSRMSPSDIPPTTTATYGGQMMPPHTGSSSGGSGPHPPGVMNPGASTASGGYMPYPPHGQMMHPHHGGPPSYPYPPTQQPPPQQQQSQQMHHHHGQFYSHSGPGAPYYPQHYHPHHPAMSQYSRTSPHPIDGGGEYDKNEHQVPPSQAAYYHHGYGGYMHPHAVDPQTGYGMMHPTSMPPDQPPPPPQQPPHSGAAHGMDLAKPPHSQSSDAGIVSYEHSHQQHSSLVSTSTDPDYLSGSSVIHPASSAEHALSLASSAVKANPSVDDATIASTEASPQAGGASSSSHVQGLVQSSTLSTTSDKNHSPESNDAHLREPLHSMDNDHHKQDSLGPITGSSEKKQTLDTASVLLAFSSTKKPRPASETSMMDDNDSKGSFPTLPTEPSFSSMISEPLNDQFVVPTEYPRRLKTPDDEEKLNALHCFMRSDLLEVVVIQPTSTADKSETASIESKNAPTSTDPQMIGRVGLRCVFCAMSPDGGRAGPSMSIFYPRTVSEIYRLVTSWKRCHLSKCRHLPPAVRQTLDGYKECRARGKTAYWIDSAHAIGLVDIPTKIGGVRFLTDSTGKIQTTRASSATPQGALLSSVYSTESKEKDVVPSLQESASSG